jgi:hypothetical protein
MLLRPATRNCGCNIGPLFRITAVKLQDVKFRALPHSGNNNRLLPLLRVQLRPLPPLFITFGSVHSFLQARPHPHVRIVLLCFINRFVTRQSKRNNLKVRRLNLGGKKIKVPPCKLVLPPSQMRRH